MTETMKTVNHTKTMKTVSHTNPEDPRNVFSEMFRRGATTPADGGRVERRGDGGQNRRNREDHGQEAEHDADQTEEEMKDVDHVPPDEEGATRVWKRGQEDDEE